MVSDKRRLVILGATGTVGIQALKIVETPDSVLEVVALSAHSRSSELERLASPHPHSSSFLTSDPEQNRRLLDFLEDGSGYDICLNAVVGAAGLPFSAATLAAGHDLALANKESLVCAGAILTTMAETFGGQILAVDSEHSAIAQCLEGASANQIRKLILTASGGALRDLPLADLPTVTPAQALAHPNWDMGPRITIDSATMMNKALEVIEAQHLFATPSENIEVVIHRQSIVHSMVEFVDGSVLAQMGPPNMRYPIHWALHFPGRTPSKLPGFDPQLFAQLEFSPADPERYPLLEIGAEAARCGGAAGAVLNAADEVAVAAFLAGTIGFNEIPKLCGDVLSQLSSLPASTLDEVFAADREARSLTTGLLSATTR
jgi:1-deoxy-D-xylulose-5-phosphate reductoisomerase